ncbi:unnamed protein product [Closterium sp. NIES-53]
MSENTWLRLPPPHRRDTSRRAPPSVGSNVAANAFDLAGGAASMAAAVAAGVEGDWRVQQCRIEASRVAVLRGFSSQKVPYVYTWRWSLSSSRVSKEGAGSEAAGHILELSGAALSVAARSVASLTYQMGHYTAMSGRGIGPPVGSMRFMRQLMLAAAVTATLLSVTQSTAEPASLLTDPASTHAPSPFSNSSSNSSECNPGVPHVAETSAKGDPHLIGRHGEKFEFHGQDGASYCLVSDRKVQINMHLFAGAKNGSTSAADVSTAGVQGQLEVNSASLPDDILTIDLLRHTVRIERCKASVRVRVRGVVDLTVDILPDLSRKSRPNYVSCAS